jgi:hypothetical protein
LPGVRCRKLDSSAGGSRQRPGGGRPCHTASRMRQIDLLAYPDRGPRPSPGRRGYSLARNSGWCRARRRWARWCRSGWRWPRRYRARWCRSRRRRPRWCRATEPGIERPHSLRTHQTVYRYRGGSLKVSNGGLRLTAKNSINTEVW